MCLLFFNVIIANAASISLAVLYKIAFKTTCIINFNRNILAVTVSMITQTT